MRLGIMSGGRGSDPLLSCARDSGLCGVSGCLTTAATSGRVSRTFLSCARDSGLYGGSSCSSTAVTSGRYLRITTLLRSSGIGGGGLRLITRNSGIGLAGGLVVTAATGSTIMPPCGQPGGAGVVWVSRTPIERNAHKAT